MTEEESLKYMLTELDRCALRRIPEIAEELDRVREGLRHAKKLQRYRCDGQHAERC